MTFFTQLALVLFVKVGSVISGALESRTSWTKSIVVGSGVEGNCYVGIEECDVLSGSLS